MNSVLCPSASSKFQFSHPTGSFIRISWHAQRMCETILLPTHQSQNPITGNKCRTNDHKYAEPGITYNLLFARFSTNVWRQFINKFSKHRAKTYYKQLIRLDLEKVVFLSLANINVLAAVILVYLTSVLQQAVHGPLSVRALIYAGKF
jgi:hypothetical protein